MGLWRRIEQFSDGRLLIIALTVSWLAWGLWPLSWPLDLLAGGLLFRRRSRLAKWAILGSFYFVISLLSLFSGYIAYSQGLATKISPKAVFGDSTQLDRRLRIPLRRPLPIQLPVQCFWLVPHDIAYELAYRMIGPMPGSYHGPLPSRSKAASSLALQGREISLHDFDTLSIELDGRSYSFPNAKRQLRYGIANDTQIPGMPEIGFGDIDENSTVRIAQIEGQGMVVGHKPHGFRMDQKDVLIDVIDIKGDSVVARYW